MTRFRAGEATVRAIGNALADPVVTMDPLSGGDINQAFTTTLKSGRKVFVKTNDRADARMFPCEARGLRWLAEAEALRVPKVLAVSDGGVGPSFLVLELLPTGPRSREFSRELGRGVAKLHHAGAGCFGHTENNFLATLHQDNTPCEAWSEFYSRRRLEPLAKRAVDRRIAPAGWVKRFTRLFATMDELVGPIEPPARLHGDLWSGNIHGDDAGNPCLIDPAVYGGHREIDLAMLELFGNPGGDFYAAYDEYFPLAAGYQERLALCQLYPLLAHVNLFGGSYVASVERALGQYE